MDKGKEFGQAAAALRDFQRRLAGAAHQVGLDERVAQQDRQRFVGVLVRGRQVQGRQASFGLPQQRNKSLVKLGCNKSREKWNQVGPTAILILVQLQFALQIQFSAKSL